ncbi:MAG: aminoacyl-tRNA hydrolase [Gammaproteobacteria bacterium]|nr:aminoacyl-tRNA hydrolase [Gammaproteobacteria bacterium]
MAVEIGGIAIPERALGWKFVRASGPGGQNVNKVATAVECRLDLNEAGLEPDVRRRLERLAGSRLTGSGEVVIFAETHRTQARNREAAIARLGALIEGAKQAPKRRIPTRPSASARAGRLRDKRHRAELKKARRRVDTDGS